MNPGAGCPVCIACSIFRSEVEGLQDAGRIELPVAFLSSLLHLTPQLLHDRLRERIERETSQGRRVVLAFGDCCPRMEAFESPRRVVRTTGLNCCEVILGTEDYRRLRREGAFFVMPEWALRWREVFEAGLGLSPENARELMGEMHTRLVYLDTGRMPVPEVSLSEMADYSGLPYDVLPVSLEPLLANLQECLRRMEEA